MEIAPNETHNLLLSGLLCVDIDALERKEFILRKITEEVEIEMIKRVQDIVDLETKIILKELKAESNNEEMYFELERELNYRSLPLH